MGLKRRRNTRICSNTSTKFITIVYPPTVSGGTMPCMPASENDKGNDEMTLLPRSDFIHSTTPSVIR